MREANLKNLRLLITLQKIKSGLTDILDPKDYLIGDQMLPLLWLTLILRLDRKQILAFLKIQYQTLPHLIKMYLLVIILIQFQNPHL